MSATNVPVFHLSGLVFQSDELAAEDYEKTFKRQRKRGSFFGTGTETGVRERRQVVREIAHEYGYRVHFAMDCWVALHTEVLVPHTWQEGERQVISFQEGFGPHGNRGITWAGGEVNGLGTVFVSSSHYLTKGRDRSQTPGGVNYDLNTKLANAIDEWGHKFSRGSQLAFHGSDTNILDRKDDVFRGGKFETLGDELGHYPGTGHGDIDVIASWSGDKRVTGARWRALDDRKFPLHGDHFLVEGAFEIVGTR